MRRIGGDHAEAPSGFFTLCHSLFSKRNQRNKKPRWQNCVSRRPRRFPFRGNSASEVLCFAGSWSFCFVANLKHSSPDCKAKKCRLTTRVKQPWQNVSTCCCVPCFQPTATQVCVLVVWHCEHLSRSLIGSRTESGPCGASLRSFIDIFKAVCCRDII